MHKKRFIICPKCGKRGFPTSRWVRNSYYPQILSLEIMVYEEFLYRLKVDPNDQYAQHMVNVRRPFIRGKRYRGRPDKHLISEKEDSFDKEECFRIHTRKYYYVYVGHYDKNLYQKQKMDYEKKLRKSKPTGRRWCKLPKEYGRCNYSDRGGIVLRKIENLENYLIDRYGEIPYR